jgi:hypothetical protein
LGGDDVNSKFGFPMFKTPAFASSQWWPLGFGDWFGSRCKEVCL